MLDKLIFLAKLFLKLSYISGDTRSSCEIRFCFIHSGRVSFEESEKTFNQIMCAAFHLWFHSCHFFNCLLPNNYVNVFACLCPFCFIIIF